MIRFPRLPQQAGDVYEKNGQQYRVVSLEMGSQWRLRPVGGFGADIVVHALDLNDDWTLVHREGAKEIPDDARQSYYSGYAAAEEDFEFYFREQARLATGEDKKTLEIIVSLVADARHRKVSKSQIYRSKKK